jgi:undecaprenyl-diphosphatase
VPQRVIKVARTLSTGFALAFFLIIAFGWIAHSITLGTTMQFDSAVREAVHRAASPRLTPVMIAISTAARPGVLLVLAVILAVILWRRGQKTPARMLLVTMAGAVVLDVALKAWFQRTRPEAYFGYPLPVSYSFPSGHSLFSACFFAGVAIVSSPLLRRTVAKVLLWTAAILLIAVVGISRVYLGVHYPTDVIGGYMAATVWLAALSESNRIRARRVQQR